MPTKYSSAFATANASTKTHEMIFAEILILGIYRTRHHKILPDKNSVAVTEIIEFVGFINSAAPDSDGITAHVIKKLENLR